MGHFRRGRRVLNLDLINCQWCGKGPELHGPPGKSKMGGPKDRLCPCDGYGMPVTSQFYSPKAFIYLHSLRECITRIHYESEEVLKLLSVLEGRS